MSYPSMAAQRRLYFTRPLGMSQSQKPSFEPSMTKESRSLISRSWVEFRRSSVTSAKVVTTAYGGTPGPAAERLGRDGDPDERAVRPVHPHEDVRERNPVRQRAHGRVLRPGEGASVLADGAPGGVRGRAPLDLGAGEPQDPLGGGIAGDDPAGGLLDDDALRHRRHDGAHPLLAIAKRLLGALAPADVGEHDAHRTRHRIGAAALTGDLGGEDRAPASPHGEVAGTRLVVAPDLGEEAPPGGHALRLDQRCEAGPPELPAVDAEERRGGQVGILDPAGGVDREVADRGEVVEIQVAIPGVCEIGLGALQLLVLHLQLDLMDLELVQEFRCGQARGRIRGGAGEPGLGAPSGASSGPP